MSRQAAPAPTGALQRWHRELAAGTRTTSNFDHLWAAASLEARAREEQAAGMPGAERTASEAAEEMAKHQRYECGPPRCSRCLIGPGLTAEERSALVTRIEELHAEQHAQDERSRHFLAIRAARDVVRRYGYDLVVQEPRREAPDLTTAAARHRAIRDVRIRDAMARAGATP